MLVLATLPALGQTADESTTDLPPRDDVASSRAQFSDEWQFQLVPWLWATAVTGDATVKGVSADFDVGFDDIFDKLSFGGMLEVEARKGRFGIYGNLVYADLSADNNIGPLQIEVTTRLLMTGAGVGYRFGPWQLDAEGSAAGPSFLIEPILGIRYTYLDTKLVSNADRLNARGSKNWIDPVLGARAILQVSPNWSVTALGDIGGFGIGSDLSWQAAGLVNYDFDFYGEKNASVGIGYRALGQDYSEGSSRDRFEYDVVYHGPVVALAFRF